MRIYRPVCTSIWYDDKFPYASDDCQHVWFHVFTHPLSTPFGLVIASLEGLAADKNRNGAWPTERYRKAFDEAVALGFFKYDARALLVYFPNYFTNDNKQNHPNNPNVILSWAERWAMVPASPLKDECFEVLKALCEAKGEPFMAAFIKGFTKGSLKGYPKGYPKGSLNREHKHKHKREQEHKPNTPDSGVPGNLKKDSPPSLFQSTDITVPDISPEDILDTWNKSKLTPCKKLGPTIKKRITTLLKDHPDMLWWQELFLRVQTSDFLSGRKTDWSASLDWVIGPKNLEKIESGRYDNHKTKAAFTDLAEAFINHGKHDT